MKGDAVLYGVDEEFDRLWVGFVMRLHRCEG